MQGAELDNGPKMGVEQVPQSSREQLEQSSGEQLARSSREQMAQSSGEQVAQPSGEQVTQPSQDQKPAFPPEPPPVLGSAGGVFPPDVSDLGGSLSSGSFSRVSAVNMSGLQSALELAMLEPEFPEDWEDAYVVPSLSSDVDAKGFLKDSRGSDGRSSPDPSWGSREQGFVEARGNDSDMPRQEGSEVGSMRSPSECARFSVQQSRAHDALGSFVGSLVKSDVARFGSSCSDHKLPWESDFARRLLDPDCEWDPLQGFKQESVIPPLSAAAPAEKPVKAATRELQPGAVFAWAVSLGAAARDPAAERERKLDQGVSMWSQLVVRFSECCTLYDCVLEGLEPESDVPSCVSSAVAAAVGVKSPHTIHKRAASFWTFVRWLDVHEPLSSNRLHEIQVWNFVQYLKKTEAPATKAAAVLSAFRFAHFVLGFKVEGVIESRRIKGATEQQLVSLRKLRQARNLTVAQVLQLHARLESGALHAFDRAFVASLLIRLYARARPSDLLFIESVEVDCPAGAEYPLLVFEVSQHKGARKVQLKSRLLPILVPMIGVNGKCWAGDAIRAFADAGRSLSSVRGPLTLAPSDESGTVHSRRSVSSAEVGRALRAFLGVPEENLDPAAPRVTAYSLRGTCLGWGGKFGFDEDLKSVLGRHSSSIKTTQAIYSRELAAAPARKLQDMIREIAEGRFFPDNSRSSYFPSQASSQAPPVNELADKAVRPQPVKIEISSSEESLPGEQESSESESTGSASSSSGDNEVPPVVKRWRRAKVEASDQVWYVHTVSGMLHLVASPEDVPMMLACGRPVNANYRQASKDEVCNGAECRTCRRNI